MIDGPNIISSLRALCEGTYSPHDVHAVISVLQGYAEKTLRRLISRGWNIGSTTEDLQATALSVLGPLTARDESGVFYRIRKRIGNTLADDHQKVISELETWISSWVRQELIRQFMLEDPVGRMFYRSLRYVIAKHDGWRKCQFQGRRVICNAYPTRLAEHAEFTVAFRSGRSHSNTLAGVLDHLLMDLIEERNLAVPLHDLLQNVRAVETGMGQQTSVDDDPLLLTNIRIYVRETVIDLDNRILERYELQGKLSPAERAAFRQELIRFLYDLATGSLEDNLRDYLKHGMDDSLTPSRYIEQFRTSWEYVTKIARQEFSERARKDHMFRQGHHEESS